jgi:hypothetical protein
VTLTTHAHLLALCHLPVRLAQRCFPSPLPEGSGDRPQLYSAESLALLVLLSDCGFSLGDPSIRRHGSMLHSLRTPV